MLTPTPFLYPALLLLLSEEPRHGYRLVDAMLRLGFGPVDRASVYRALGDLEADGLLYSWSASPTAGSTRHVYALTDEGVLALDQWRRPSRTSARAWRPCCSATTRCSQTAPPARPSRSRLVRGRGPYPCGVVNAHRR